MTRRVRSVAAVAVVMLAACGGGGGGGGGGGEDLPAQATISSESSPAPVPLAPGRYRLTINEACDDFGITITSEDGNFTYETTNPPIRILFVNDMPGGNFSVQQTSASCTDWSVDLVRVSGG